MKKKWRNVKKSITIVIKYVCKQTDTFCPKKKERFKPLLMILYCIIPYCDIAKKTNELFCY